MENDYYLVFSSGGNSYSCEGTFSGPDGKILLPENTDEGEHLVELSFRDSGHRRTVTLRAASDVVIDGYREYGHDFFAEGDPAKEYDPKGDLYFINGYQSWTDTREYYGDTRERDVKSLPAPILRSFSLDRYGDAMFYKYDKRVLHGYDVFYVKGKTTGFVLNLNYAKAYLIVEVVRRTGEVTLISDLSGSAVKSGDVITLCDYYYSGDVDEGIGFLKETFRSRTACKIFGYTSWYNYYQNIDAGIISRDLAALDSRFNLFQIDDGYETFVGDWLSVDEKKFPDGLSGIVSDIHGKGLMAGIWLAPFVAEEKSETFKDHPDWFRKGPDGLPVKCGSNWSGFYALDLDHPEVLSYVEKCLKTYADMGFDFFKLDFLYAANLPDYEGRTRSEQAEYAYSFLRKVLGDKLILGCGATLFNAAGKFDYMRIGPDVSLKFDDVWYMRFMHRERISTKVTLQNTIFRSFMDGCLFGNDPDVFLLRDDNISLTAAQRKALITINALFGSVMMTSDNVAEYDRSKLDALDGALTLFNEAEVTDYSRRGDVITIVYALGGRSFTIKYDTEKGIII